MIFCYQVDFQQSVYCSPIADFSLFLLMTIELGGDFQSDLIRCYHERFKKTLKAFGGVNSPSLLDLNLELLRHGAVNILFTITYLPCIFADWSQLKAEDLIGRSNEESTKIRKSVYNDPRCKATMLRELKSWTQKGWF